MIDSMFKVVFGDRESSLEKLKSTYPELRFLQLKQVHGDLLVPASDQRLEADAHWTGDNQVGLVIATADCLPVFASCSATNRIVGIHAGWRGVLNQITKKSIHWLLQSGSLSSSLQIYIGPHIQFQSFEIEDSFRDQLLSTVKVRPDSVFVQNPNGKSKVNLSKIVQQQLIDLGLGPDQFRISTDDTLTNSNYHSYRRDRERSGRQLSFIYQSGSKK